MALGYTKNRQQKTLGVVNLRPHHLLCIRTFSGAGYSHEFIDNMHRVVSACKIPSQTIKIVEGLDDICACCPHNQGNLCIRNDDMAKGMDKRTLSILGLRLDFLYNSLNLGDIIEIAIQQGLFCDVCERCEWFDPYCRSYICNSI